jgi:hypothetical protein
MNTLYIPRQYDMVEEGRYAAFYMQLRTTLPYIFDVSASLGPGLVGRSALFYNVTRNNPGYFRVATPDSQWGEEVTVAPLSILEAPYFAGMIIGKVSMRGSIDDILETIVFPGRPPEPPVVPPELLSPTEGNMARSILKSR